MSMFEFGKKTRRNRRSLRRGSVERKGNRISIRSVRGKTKILKIRKNFDGREYYVSGKRKTKHFLDKRKSRRKRHFGYMKDGLINYMGNFQPNSQMSLAQSTTGMSASQMIDHLKNIPSSVRSNFYTNIK